jgi:hypothetical protein
MKHLFLNLLLYTYYHLETNTTLDMLHLYAIVESTTALTMLSGLAHASASSFQRKHEQLLLNDGSAYLHEHGFSG